MQARDFCYWLQGALELPAGTDSGLTAEQLKVVQDHLNMVFVHDLDPKAVEEKLQNAHDGQLRPDEVMRC